MQTEGNSNIQVEITDASEFHCFKLTLNPKGTPDHAPCSQCCEAVLLPVGDREGTMHYECEACGKPCDAMPAPNARIEVMLHARSLVDLIHKCSLALCDWQSQTAEHLICQITGLDAKEAREKGLIA